MSCQQGNPYSSVKTNLLYKDKKNYIYLKEKMDIASEKHPKNDKTVYLDAVLYKDKVLKLSQFADTVTFRQIGTKDDKDVFVKGIYEDKKYKYIFRDHPASYPNILVLDR